MIYASYSKLSKELKNDIKIKLLDLVMDQKQSKYHFNQ